MENEVILLNFVIQFKFVLKKTPDFGVIPNLLQDN